ncbi:phosphocholine cytidylyltransferase family protein [Thermaurantiacus sp.]
MPGGGLHAIVLAAGAGSRLQPAASVKPLAEVAGRPLILHALDSLAAAGADSATVVTGFAAPDVEAALLAAPVPVRVRHNPDWATTPNGVSLLAACADVMGPTLLMMADHLVSPALIHRLVAEAPPDAGLVLAVDRRLGHPLVDEADVTRVRTMSGRLLAIGKRLLSYDCYDTGVFIVTERLIRALEGLSSPGLSDGVARLAGEGDAAVVDIGNAFWIDVDDPAALRAARGLWPR